MADRIVEAYWDCSYCGTKGISGVKHKKHCPNCGHPQDKGVEFYLKPQNVYIDGAEAEDYKKGPDWVCNYCNSYNNQKFIYCCNCGASKDGTKDYFTQNDDNKTKNNISKVVKTEVKDEVEIEDEVKNEEYIDEETISDYYDTVKPIDISKSINISESIDVSEPKKENKVL